MIQLFGILTNCVYGYVCFFGRKLQTEFASCSLCHTQLQLEFVYQRNKLSTMMKSFSLLISLSLPVALHCNDVIHIFTYICVAIHIRILKNKCHSDIPKGDTFVNYSRGMKKICVSRLTQFPSYVLTHVDGKCWALLTVCIRSNWMMMIWLWQQTTWIYLSIIVNIKQWHDDVQKMLLTHHITVLCLQYMRHVAFSKINLCKMKNSVKFAPSSKGCAIFNFQFFHLKLFCVPFVCETFFLPLCIEMKKRQITTNKFPWEREKKLFLLSYFAHIFVN